jgi:DNA-binding NarL/FixJ family response regulator
MSAQLAMRQVRVAGEPKRTWVLMIAIRDQFVDEIIRILESSDDNLSVTCVAPDDPCARYFAGECPDLLLLQEKSKPDPFEDFVREMVEGFPGLRVLVIGQSMSDDYLYRVINAGASGYINEKMQAEHMLAALDAVRKGSLWVERHIMERFIVDNSLVDGIYSRVASLSRRLTNREAEVLSLVMAGLSTREIAERVFLSHQGVKAHLTTLFRKFEVKNRSQLILRALDEVSPVHSITSLVQDGLQASRSVN